MQVPCPHRGDHLIVKGRMHGPAQCPPPPGHTGEHHRVMKARKKTKNDGVFDARGVAVAGVGGSKAKTHRRGKKKITTGVQ